MRTLFFVVFAVVALVTLSNINVTMTDAVEMQAPLAWAMRTVGGIIAAAAGTLILLRAALGDTLPQIAPLVVAALVGALLGGADWGVSLALGAIIAVVAARNWLSRQD
jgi:hypothetical protein